MTFVLELSSADLHRAKRNMSEALRMVKAACQSQWHAHLSPCIVLPLPCGEPARSPRDGLMGKPTDTRS